MLHGAAVIAAKDLRQRFRDRSALVLGFVAPLLMVGLMNAAFAGAGEFHATVGVVDADGGVAGTGILDGLRSPDLADVLTVETFPSADAARAAVDDGAVDAAIVLPAGLTAMAGGGPAVPIDVFTSVDADLAGEVTASIATAFTAQIATLRLTAAVADAAGASEAEVGSLLAQVATAPPPIQAMQQATGNDPLEPVAYFGPGMAMFFVLFSVGFTARGFFVERTTGTLDRMAAAPIRPEAVLAGKALSVFVYALASLATMAAVTAVVFGASWGDPLGVAVLCVAMAASVVALAALVMAVARTERQAEGLASMLTFALALLGGSFLFLGSAPPLMRRLAVLTPNGWALRGFTDLATGVDVWTAVAAPVAGMAAICVVVGTIALVAGRGAVTR